MILDFDKLKETDPGLHRTVAQQTGFISGEHEVEFMDFAPTTRRRLSDARKAQQPPESTLRPLANRMPPPAAPVAPAMVKREEPEAIREAMDVSKNDERRRVEQQARDADAGIARLQQYVDEQGLEESSANLAAVQAFIDAQVKGYWSSEIVDAAIQNLGPKGTNVLKWAPKPAPVPPPPEPAEPAEHLEPWQLPIDADERMMKASTTKALLDLNLRRRKATNQMYVGKNQRGFGTSL